MSITLVTLISMIRGRYLLITIISKMVIPGQTWDPIQQILTHSLAMRPMVITLLELQVVLWELVLQLLRV